MDPPPLSSSSSVGGSRSSQFELSPSTLTDKQILNTFTPYYQVQQVQSIQPYQTKQPLHHPAMPSASYDMNSAEAGGAVGLVGSNLFHSTPTNNHINPTPLPMLDSNHHFSASYSLPSASGSPSSSIVSSPLSDSTLLLSSRVLAYLDHFIKSDGAGGEGGQLTLEEKITAIQHLLHRAEREYEHQKELDFQRSDLARQQYELECLNTQLDQVRQKQLQLQHLHTKQQQQLQRRNHIPQSSPHTSPEYISSSSHPSTFPVSSSSPPSPFARRSSLPGLETNESMMMDDIPDNPSIINHNTKVSPFHIDSTHRRPSNHSNSSSSSSDLIDSSSHHPSHQSTLSSHSHSSLHTNNSFPTLQHRDSPQLVGLKDSHRNGAFSNPFDTLNSSTFLLPPSSSSSSSYSSSTTISPLSTISNRQVNRIGIVAVGDGGGTQSDGLTASSSSFATTASHHATSVLSKIFLKNFLSLDTLESYRIDYESGKMSHAALQQHVNWMGSHLDDDDRQLLAEVFQRMSVDAIPRRRMSIGAIDVEDELTTIDATGKRVLKRIVALPRIRWMETQCGLLSPTVAEPDDLDGQKKHENIDIHTN